MVPGNGNGFVILIFSYLSVAFAGWPATNMTIVTEHAKLRLHGCGVGPPDHTKSICPSFHFQDMRDDGCP